MTSSARDRELGMNRPITRRDFLNGAAIAAGAMAAGVPLGSAEAAGTNPAALTGLRGHHPGSFEVMHSLRDGTFWQTAGAPESTGETYDLVVVGGGISGLAAAFLYRHNAGSKARVLILENHDDFGGHAKRNEFTSASGKQLIGYGGSQSLQTPSYFTPAVKKLLRDIGIDTEKFHKYYDEGWAEKRGLGDGVFFRKELFGTDQLVKMTEKAADWVPKTPLNGKARRRPPTPSS
jgi:spermidine dehydrogenase